MKKFGINNVRGGSYSQIELSEDVYRLLQKEIIHAEDRCFFCGFNGHVEKNCELKSLPFRNDNIPSKEEFDKFFRYLEGKNLREKTQVKFGLQTLQSFFSKKVKDINNFFPYLKFIGDNFGFETKINDKVYGGSILWNLNK